MAYQLVVFDLGGVAVEVESDRLIHQLAQLLGRTFEEVQAAIYHEELLLPFELGRIRPQAYYEGLKARLKLPWAYEQFVRSWNGIFRENVEVTSLMRRLCERHKLTVLTNTNVLHLEHIKRTVASLSIIEDWVASCEVGLRKPDPQIYRLALERAGARPDAAVYIDDRPELVEAGRSLGLTGIRFESSQQLEEDLRAIGFNI
ncbi:MAG: HAD family phosphatase [Candidatus Omnitrophica bacterium]|nr:HAD family phosphatase [Candidatus Omnitrophota bacterium]MBI2495228.1 HAD family phosphatase [Candidatus Omnitrophota bacterium]MBI3020571.1 HAD family phosphatase [Candidatus Omnitrophota bacterium]MBI3082750.1 HAD family phosphatase [Candidatus Omnitrophota bacterium]